MNEDIEIITKTEALVDHLIATYKSKNTNYNSDYIADSLEKIFSHCPFLILEQWNNATLIRVRQGDVQKSFDENHFFQRTEDFLPNPQIDKIKIGRCNREKQQVFYASFSEQGAQYEAMSEFRDSDFSDVNERHVTYFGVWTTNRILRLANIINENNSREFMTQHHPEWCDVYMKIENIIQSAFSEPSSPSVYCFTAEVSNYFLKKADGVVYDSHKTHSQAKNVALNPYLLYDGSMAFERASRVRRLSYNKDYRKERVDNWIGVPIGEGKLSWQPSLRTLMKGINQQGMRIKFTEKGEEIFKEEYGYDPDLDQK